MGADASQNADTGAANNTGVNDTKGDAADKTAEKADDKRFSQAEVNAMIAKDRRKLEERLSQTDGIAKELEALREEKRVAEEAKLSKTQREELDRKREREAYEKKIADLAAAAATERDKRHATARGHKAASLVGTIAARLYSEKAAPHIEALIASRLVVEAQADGSERLMLRMSDASADLEPIDTAWPKFCDAEIAPAFFKAQGGAGSQHGTGAGAGRTAWAHLSPADKIMAGLGAKR